MSAFVKGILSNFVSKSLVAGIGLITVILVSRFLGPEGRGQIGLFLSSVALVQLFCDFGNSSAIINLSYKVNQRVLWLSSLQWVAFICLISLPALYFIPDLSFWYLVGPAAFIYSVVNLHHLLLMGNQEVHKRNLSSLVVPTIIMFLFLGFSLLLDKRVDYYILALFIALLTGAYISYRMIASRLKLSDTTFQFESAILRQGFWVQSAQAVQFFNYRLNFFLVAFFLGDASLGIYNNAVILGESLWILGHSIAQMQHMKILNTLGNSSHYKITHKSMLVNFVGTTCLLAILLSLPSSFWTYLFGDGFIGINYLLITLSTGVLAFSISNIINHGLHATDRFKTILICNAIGLVSGFILALVFIPKLGLQGAALSWSGGLSVSLIAYLYCHFKMNWNLIDRAKTPINLVVSGIAAFLTFILSNDLIMKINFTDSIQLYSARTTLGMLVFFTSFFLLHEIFEKAKHPSE